MRIEISIIHVSSTYYIIVIAKNEALLISLVGNRTNYEELFH